MTRSSTAVPLEHEEQTRFVAWLEDRGIRQTAIPNSTYTTSYKQKAHNRATGLRAGFPDLVVIAPHQSADSHGYLLAIEMKRQRGGTVSRDQRAWIAAINGIECPQVESAVAHGADEAIEYVSHYLSHKVVENLAPF